MKKVGSPDDSIESVCERLGYTDSVVLLSAWLCTILTNKNLQRHSWQSIEASKNDLVDELVAEWHRNGNFALHPEALLERVLT